MMENEDVKELNEMRVEKVKTHIRKALGFLANKGKEDFAECLDNLENAAEIIKKITAVVE